MYNIDQKITEFIDSLPDGKRSRFVSGFLKQGVELEQLSGRFYNYVLMRPDGSVFYVGKGTGNRIDDHEIEARKGVDSYKCRVIRQVWSEDGEIIKQKVAFHNNEEDAYQLEILLINFFGKENLTNLTDGGEGAGYGNKHATLPAGQRGRINWTMGLSKEKLTKALQALDIEHLDDIAARAVLSAKSEELLKEWIKTLHTQKGAL